jgi:ubiquinone/menaquinone biosynthesis C-methylase UbiE
VQLEVERDERRAHAEEDGAPRRVEPARAEGRLELSRVEPPLELVRPTAPEEGRSTTAADLPVEEDRKPELVSHPRADRVGDVDRAVEVRRFEWDERHDVRCADARMDAFVRPQVDPSARLVDPEDESVLDRPLVSHEREDRPVVVDVDVRVQHARTRSRERVGDCGDRRRVPPLRDVRDGLEHDHARSLRPMREPTAPAYYDRRAPEYDDWYRGVGLYADRDRAGFDEDLAAMCEALAVLAPARTLDVACGTGFLTRHLRGDITGLDQSARMLEVAAARLPSATLVQGDACALPFPDDAFDRVVSGHFYGHLDESQRAVFLREARRVAPELVIADASRERSHTGEEWSERVLRDGSTWQVYKRWFTPDGLRRELGGGDVLHAGPWFVVVRSPR